MVHDEELGTDVRTVGDLGTALRRLRRRQARAVRDTELTYRELAARTGFSYGVVAEYFSGKVLAPTDRFDVLIRLLGASSAEQRALATARDRVEEQRRVAGGVALPSTRLVPHELPTDVFGFVGRYAELAALDQPVTRAATAVAIAAVTGTAGVGKTALAIHWAHAAQDRFPDGCLYVDLRGYGGDEPLTPGEALAMVLRSLGIADADIPDGTAERAARLRSRLAGTRTLLILDNARDSEHVRHLLPGTSSCMVVVTSRDDLAGLVAWHGARRVDVGPLPPAHAVELLVALIGPRAAADPATVATLAERCAHRPLALRIAAELACSRGYPSLGRLVAELGDRYRHLDVLDSATPSGVDHLVRRYMSALAS